MAKERGTKVVNSWSLLAFAKMHGTPKLAPNMENRETGEKFSSIAFTDKMGNVNCFVNFSTKLGELTMPQIIRDQHDLRVVELDSGSYRLCKGGENNWQEIALDGLN